MEHLHLERKENSGRCTTTKTSLETKGERERKHSCTQSKKGADAGHRLWAVARTRPLAACSSSSRALWSSPLTAGAPLRRGRGLQGRLHVPHRVDGGAGVTVRAAVVTLALDAPKPFRVGLQGSQVQRPPLL